MRKSEKFATNLNTTWAKDPRLKGADILIVSSCLIKLYPKIYEEFSKDKEVLHLCPEGDLGSVAYGKLASIITSTKPKSITVLTVECSPHCYTLQASVNEALYITGSKIPTKHYVCLDGVAKEISPDAIRISRYLHVVDELLKNNPQILEKINKYSLEFRRSRE